MTKLPLLLAAGAALALGVAAVHATGAPKTEHPCYEVADCQTRTSREEFSKCVKANVEEANAIEACAEFRKDKPAYMQKHGIDGVDSLFEG
jgi:deoxycytidylate deaminase